MLRGGYSINYNSSVYQSIAQQLAGQPRFARHKGLIHRSGEASRLDNAGERFAPCSLMRGREQHAVDVENKRRQLPHLFRSGHRF